MPKKTPHEIEALAHTYLRPAMRSLEQEGLMVIVLVKDPDPEERHCGVAASRTMTPDQIRELLELGALSIRMSPAGALKVIKPQGKLKH